MTAPSIEFLNPDTGEPSADCPMLMKTLHLLIGGMERVSNRLVEATALDVCFNRAAVACTSTPRASEFLRRACCGGYELLVLHPKHLLAEAGRSEPTPETLIQVVWTVKSRCSAPLIVLGAEAEVEYRFLEAGADAVLVGRWKTEELRTEIERLLSLPEPEQPTRRRTWSLAGIFGK